jgi:hypothetical protein
MCPPANDPTARSEADSQDDSAQFHVAFTCIRLSEGARGLGSPLPMEDLNMPRERCANEWTGT